MEETIIFAQTARAGRWNYRYLVPIGAKYPQKTLSELEGLVRTGHNDPKVISTKKTVIQSTTGRTGEEMLVLRDKRLVQLSDANRKLVRQVFNKYAQCLEDVVTQSIDWDTTTELVVERPELSKWLREIVDVIEKHRQEPPLISWTSEKIYSVSIVSIALAVLLVIGLFILPNLIEPSVLGKETVSDQSQVLTEIIPPSTNASLTRLAELVGVKSRNQLEDELKIKLEVLFDRPKNIHPTSSVDAVTSIKNSLKRLHAVVFTGADVPDNLNRLVSDDGFQDKLKLLFPEPDYEFDPSGLLSTDDKPIVDQLSLIRVNSFRQIVRSLNHIHAIGSDSLPKEGKYGVFFQYVYAEQENNSYQLMNNTLLPNFFCESDVQIALCLETLFQSDEAGKLLGSTYGQKNVELAKLVEQIGAEYAKGPDRRLSQKAIKIHLDEANAESTKKAFRELNLLVNSCENAVGESNMKSLDTELDTE